jgi:hypothetical protein
MHSSLCREVARVSLNPDLSFQMGSPIISPCDLSAVGGIPVTPKPDKEWFLRISKFWWATNFKGTLTEEEKKHLPLRDLLLSFGGHQACIASYELDLRLLLNHGEIWLARGARKIPGRVSRCHENSLRYWYEHQDTTSYATGYALSDDGFWRQHSWVVKHGAKGGVVLETTEPRIAYFGFPVEKDEALYLLADYI